MTSDVWCADPTNTALTAAPMTTTPIVTAFWASRYLGRFDASFDGSTRRLTSLVGNPILLGQANSSNPVTPDSEAQVCPSHRPPRIAPQRVNPKTAHFMRYLLPARL